MDNDKFTQATNLLQQWYSGEIRSLTDSAIEACVGRLITEPTKEDLANVPRDARASARAGFVPYRIKSGEMGSVSERAQSTDRREFLQEWVDSATDDHNCVIYKAQLVVATSRNDSAYEDEMGEKPLTVEAQACMAMRADVWEELEHRSDEWEGEDPEPEDDGAGVPSGTLPRDPSALPILDLGTFRVRS